LNASLIKSHSASYVMYTERNGVKTPSALLDRRIEPMTIQGRDVIRVSQTHYTGEGQNRAISIVDRETLSPISYTFNSNKQAMSLQFYRHSVTGTDEVSNTKENIALQSEKPFLASTVLDEIIQSLSLKAKFETKLTLFSTNKQINDFSVRVIGTARISLIGGKSMDAWVVERAGGGSPTTMWLDKKTHELLVQRTMLQGGNIFWRIRLYNSAED